MTIAPKPGSIMVVEDDVDVRETLCEVLADEGYTTLPFTGGQPALAYLAQCPSPPALMLLDLMMPNMDGWAVRQEQQRNAALPKVPTVILSADGNVEENMAALQADGYLRKPIHIGALLQLVEKFCRRPTPPS